MAVDTQLFFEGDVYIDFPQEECMFRYESATQRKYGWFDDAEAEHELEQGSDLFAQSRMYGTPTTRERYYATPRRKVDRGPYQP